MTEGRRFPDEVVATFVGDKRIVTIPITNPELQPERKIMKKNLKRRLSDNEAEEAQEAAPKKQQRGFDPELDKVIKEVGAIESESSREGNIIVRIASYNKGPKKIAVMRSGENKAGEQWFSARLGRITKEQAKRLRILLKKADKYI